MNPASPRARFIRRSVGLLAGAVTLAALLVSLWHESFPPLPPRLVMDIAFPRGVAHQGEPLVTTGTRSNADFLAVHYLDENTAMLFYDVWGMGGPVSAPFPLNPGTPRRLTIEMPTLAHIANFRSHEKRPLRVTLDGVVLLDEPVYFHRREPADIFFATNPAGGTVAQESFRGSLALPDGRALRGGPEAVFKTGERLRWLFRARPWALLAALALSAGVGAFARAILSACLRAIASRVKQGGGNFFAAGAPTVFPSRTVRASHGWFFAAAALSLLGFTTVITGGTFRLVAPDEFGDQYDFQARSFLQGRLDLPAEARTGESFIFQDRTYIYFGPTPALLRLPFVVLKIGFGQLTRCFMLAYFAAWLVAAHLILLHVSRLARGPGARPSAGTTVLFTSAVGCGSTMLFLASRAYVYHEAILCGAMFALWSGYLALRWIAQPDHRWWWGALACGVLSLHARPPCGLFALGLLGCAALALAGRALVRNPSDPRIRWRALCRPFAIALLAALGVLSFNVLSYLKFESFAGAPLRYHVQYNAARLAQIAGSNFHPGNFRHDFDAYVWRPDFTFRPTFPYFFLQRGNGPSYRDARIDLAESTLALPFAMPALCLLAFGGAALALVRWRESRLPLAIIAAGTAPMALALFTAIAISHRYTGDFCAPLVLAAAFGLNALDLLSVRARRVSWLALAGLSVIGILVTLAIALHYQGEEVWGVPDEIKSRYQMLRQALDSALGFSRP